MPIVISPNKFFAKNQNGSGYLPANAISQQTTDEQVALIEAKGRATRASIPDDYTELSDNVVNLENAFGVLNTNNFSILGLDNLVEWDPDSDGKYIDASGEIASLAKSHYSLYIPVEEGSYTYRFSQEVTGAAKTHRIHGYDSNKQWLRQVATKSANGDAEVSFTVSNDIKFLRFSSTEYSYNNRLIAARTIFDRSLVYRGQLTNADDMHDLSLPGMYYVNTNDGTPANFPQNIGTNYVRILVMKSENSHHTAEVHILMGADALYVERATGTGWSEWMRFNNANSSVAYQGQLTSADDMHNISYPGMYYISGGSVPANFPYENPDNARILVNKSSTPSNHTGETHFVMGATSLWVERSLNQEGTMWSGWKQLKESGVPNALEEESIALGLHTIPTSRGMLNAIKRARQLTDIKWSPSQQFLRGMFETGDTYLESHGSTYVGTFDAGKEYIGIPYSERNYIGLSNPIDCFATGIKNINSSQIIESQDQTLASNRLSYYGVNCIAFVCYALSIMLVSSAKFASIRYFTNLGYLNYNGTKYAATSLKLCDVLHESSHVAMITDIIKNSEGTIIAIEVSESTRQGNPVKDIANGIHGGRCRRVIMDIDYFYAWFEGFSVLRYQQLNSVPYLPNKYSPLANEGTPLAYWDMPCIPYEGNMHSYSIQGTRKVKVLIASQYYTHLRVLKDGELFNEYEIGANEYIEVQCDNAEATYEAYLLRYSGGNVAGASVSCMWAIRPNMRPTTLTVSNGKLLCTLSNFKPNRFKPFSVAFAEASPATADERSQFYKVFEMTTTTNQNGTVNYSFEIPYTDSTKRYAQITIQSDEFGLGSDIYLIS